MQAGVWGQWGPGECPPSLQTLLLRRGDDGADSVFPFSGRCQCVDLETESQGKHHAVQILQNNNKLLTFHMLFILTEELISFLKGEVNRG